MEIFIHRDDQDFGPYSIEEAQEHLASGALLPEDHAYYEGAADWMPLEEIPGVMPAPIAGQETASVPKPSNVGLPKWIPPRRVEDSAMPATFSPRPTHALGITQKPPGGDEPGRVKPGAPKPAAAISSAKVTSAPLASAPAAERPEPEVTPYAEHQEAVPIPGFTRSMRSIGARNMIFGALWFIGGSAITLYSYESALGEKHGGTYLVTWGAIIGGLIQFVRGAMQYSKG